MQKEKNKIQLLRYSFIYYIIQYYKLSCSLYFLPHFWAFAEMPRLPKLMFT